MKSFYPIISLSVFVALSSCSKVQDMHDATMEMNKTTAQMNQTTAKVAEVAKDTKDLMFEIYDSGRQGAALDLRNGLWEKITHATKVEEKATNAGLYLIAFEFQLWSKLGNDAQNAQRERLMKDAVDEFFCHLLAITHWTDVDPFAGGNPISFWTNFNPLAGRTLVFGEVDNEKASFNALALTLERANRKEENFLDEAGDMVNMRKMIETALRASKDIKDGKATIRDFPAYIDVILSHEESAKKLLRARYQILGLAALTQLTSISRSTMDGLKFKYLGKKWDLDFKKLNSSEMALIQFRLKEAIRAREVLESIGETPALNADIKKIYAQGNVVNRISPHDVQANSALAKVQQAQSEFLHVLKSYSSELKLELE